MKNAYRFIGAIALAISAYAPCADAGVCRYVRHAAGVAGGAVVAAGSVLELVGIQAVAHSSGAMIVSTASGGYVAGTLGGIGTTVSALSGPIGWAIGGGLLATATYCHLNDSARVTQHKSISSPE